jgi:ATP-dependent Clp protease ATP-binding subunit ClpX
VQVDTTHILFVCGGTFSHLDKIIERRLGKRDIGFHDRERNAGDRDSLISFVETEDLIAFGMIPEFVGRFPVVSTLAALDEKSLLDILVKPKNALVRQFRKFFEMEGVELTFTDAALREIVKEAFKKGTGARGLRAILEDVMLDIMYELPSLENVHECVIDGPTVARRERPVLVDKRGANKKIA